MCYFILGLKLANLTYESGWRENVYRWHWKHIGLLYSELCGYIDPELISDRPNWLEAGYNISTKVLIEPGTYCHEIYRGQEFEVKRIKQTSKWDLMSLYRYSEIVASSSWYKMVELCTNSFDKYFNITSINFYIL